MSSFRLTRIACSTAVLAVALVLTTACSDEATAPQSTRLPSGISAVDNPDLAKNLTILPTIDGTISKGEYTGAATFTYMAQVPSAFSIVKTPVTVYVMHDDTNLYLAATFDRKSPFRDNDLIAFEFDNDNDGLRENDDDILLKAPSGQPNVLGNIGDFYRFNGGISNASDASDGGTMDGNASWGVIGTKGVFEFRHPLNSADNLHDFSVNPWIFPQTVGIQSEVQLEAGAVGSGQYARTFKPSSTTYCKLTISKTNTVVICP